MRQEKKRTVGSERSRYMHATARMGIRLGTVEKMNEGFFPISGACVMPNCTTLHFTDDSHLDPVYP